MGDYILYKTPIQLETLQIVQIFVLYWNKCNTKKLYRT